MVVHPCRWFLCALLLTTVLGTSIRADSLAPHFNDRSNDLPGNTQENFDSFILGNIGSSTAIQTGTNTLV